MLPFVAFVVIMVFARNHRGISAGLSIGAVTVSLLCALSLLARHWHLETPLQYLGRWLVSGDISIPFGSRPDQPAHAGRGGHHQLSGPGLFPGLYGR